MIQDKVIIFRYMQLVVLLQIQMHCLLAHPLHVLNFYFMFSGKWSGMEFHHTMHSIGHIDSCAGQEDLDEVEQYTSHC